jgi:hypothetical protein
LRSSLDRIERQRVVRRHGVTVAPLPTTAVWMQNAVEVACLGAFGIQTAK